MKKKTHCGAKIRSGIASVRKTLANGRCRKHSGVSTGPKTAAGRARSLANLVWNR